MERWGRGRFQGSCVGQASIRTETVKNTKCLLPSLSWLYLMLPNTFILQQHDTSGAFSVTAPRGAGFEVQSFAYWFQIGRLAVRFKGNYHDNIPMVDW
jgi:hypothetical protein